jgi:GT2 family glycosyltransferase
MRISVVAAYVNRKNLFYQTLKSITKTKHDDFEVIAVDDGSSPEHRIEDLKLEFPFLKIIRIEPENRWYVNTCIPYNVGIQAAVGDIIIIQNAECLHVHDIITYLSERVDNNNYISISTYALTQQLTEQLPQIIDNPDFMDFFKKLPQITFSGIGWYNHSKYRPLAYHFCSGITRKNIHKLGGFDERYALGTSYEDNELVERIKRMGLKMIIADEVSVIHQWHHTFQYSLSNTNALQERNRLLFLNTTMKETTYTVNNKQQIDENNT